MGDSGMSVNEMSGGEAIARMFAAHEVGPMFGMGGFQLLPFYDEYAGLASATTSSTTSARESLPRMPTRR